MVYLNMQGKFFFFTAFMASLQQDLSEEKGQPFLQRTNSVDFSLDSSIRNTQNDSLSKPIATDKILIQTRMQERCRPIFDMS